MLCLLFIESIIGLVKGGRGQKGGEGRGQKGRATNVNVWREIPWG